MPLTLTLSLLVPSSLLLHSFSDTSPLHLRYASVMPPLFLHYTFASLTKVDRVHNGGWSSSLRRMIEFTTEDERRTNEEPTKEYIYIRDGRHTNPHTSLNVFCNNSTAWNNRIMAWNDRIMTWYNHIMPWYDDFSPPWYMKIQARPTTHLPFLLLPIRDRIPADFSVAICFLTMRSDIPRASASC